MVACFGRCPIFISGYLVGRVIVLVCALLSETVVARNPALTSGDPTPLLRALTSWDGWFYLGIARDGYHVDEVAGGYHDYAFLPLYPRLVRIIATPFPGAVGAVSGFLSHLLLALASVLLFQLGRRYLGDHRAALACFLLAISPFSRPSFPWPTRRVSCWSSSWVPFGRGARPARCGRRAYRPDGCDQLTGRLDGVPLGDHPSPARRVAAALQPGVAAARPGGGSRFPRLRRSLDRVPGRVLR